MNLNQLLQELGLSTVSGTTAALVAIALAALIVMDLHVADSNDVPQ